VVAETVSTKKRRAPFRRALGRINSALHQSAAGAIMSAAAGSWETAARG
jgi:hypothetical protein